MSSKRSHDGKVVMVKVEGEVKDKSSTPAKSSPPPVVLKKRKMKAMSRVLVGRVVEQLCISTPVKQWPRGFWSARRNLYEECESFKPSTPVKICPPSPQDIFK